VARRFVTGRHRRFIKLTSNLPRVSPRDHFWGEQKHDIETEGQGRSVGAPGERDGVGGIRDGRRRRRCRTIATISMRNESLAIVPVFDPRAPHDYFLFLGGDNDFITIHGSMVGSPYTDKADVDSLVLVYCVTLPTYVPPHRDGNDDDQDQDHDGSGDR
jgi:hypothetical protein